MTETSLDVGRNLQKNIAGEEQRRKKKKDGMALDSWPR